MEYYSFLEKNEILAYARMWKNLENTMLNEITKTPKGTDIV